MTAAVKNVGEEEEEDGQLDSSVPAPLRRVRMLRMGQSTCRPAVACHGSRVLFFFTALGTFLISPNFGNFYHQTDAIGTFMACVPDTYCWILTQLP